MATKHEKPKLHRYSDTVQLGITDGERTFDLGRAVIEWKGPEGSTKSKSELFWGGGISC